MAIKNKKKEKTPNKKGGLGKILFSLIMAIILFFVLISIESNILDKYEKVNTVVAVVDIEKGTEITSSNVKDLFEVREIDKKLEISTDAKELEDLVGFITDKDFGLNEIVSFNDLINKESVLIGIDNPTDISITVNNISKALAGTLRQGDFIDISVLLSETGQNVKMINHVYIKEAYDGAGVVAGRDSETPSIMLLITLDKEDLGWFYEATNKGDIRINSSDYSEYETFEEEVIKELEALAEAENPQEEEVYVSENDLLYHDENCENLGDVVRTMTVEDAKAQGFTIHEDCLIGTDDQDVENVEDVAATQDIEDISEDADGQD